MRPETLLTTRGENNLMRIDKNPIYGIFSGDCVPPSNLSIKVTTSFLFLIL
jgi:hypothetical protein